MAADNHEMDELYEKSFRQISEGSIIRGKVVEIRPDDSIVLDIGYKSEGFVPIGEFSPEELAQISIGDEFDVFVERLRDSDGTVALSKERAARTRALHSLNTSFRDGTPVQGRIVKPIKGGYQVELLVGIRAFLPGSQVDLRPVKDADALIGMEMPFKILRLNSKLTNIIVSRRAIIEEQREKLRAETLEHLREGVRLTGTIKNITGYGVFVDLGGIDGLLHISDISWGRIAHPSDVFKVGDSVEVLVLKYDESAGKVTLGYKQLKPDPWEGIEQRYAPASTVTGRVVSITDYGIFMEVEDGVEGLVHVSELDWSPRPKHPSKYASLGSTLEAKVLKVDSAERRLSLSVRQTKPKPWDLVAERYAVGQTVTGKVRTLTDFGAFVGLPEGVDALIHISDMSWTRHIKHPSELLKKGQKVDAVVLSLSPEHEKMALGMKQLVEDPWKRAIPEKYHLGDEVECRILRVTDFGIFVEIGGEVEGLIYSSEVDASRGTEAPFQEGEIVRARVIKIEPEERKIGLSMKNVSAANPGPEEDTPSQ